MTASRPLPRRPFSFGARSITVGANPTERPSCQVFPLPSRAGTWSLLRILPWHNPSRGALAVHVIGDPRQTHQMNVSAVGAEPASDTPSYFNMPAGLLFVLWGEQEEERPHVLGLLLSALIPSPEENFKVKKESFLPRNTGLQHQASTNKLSCNFYSSSRAA